MSEQLLPVEDRLLEALAGSVRGPKRNGIFAVWMFLRACDALLPPDGLTIRTHRRRLQSLERRMTSLSMPAPLRRALASGVRELMDGSGTAAVMALHRLVAPAREALGSDVGEAIAAAARIARDAAPASSAEA